MAFDRRRHPREVLSVPIRLADGTEAMTRNISQDGIYFLVPRQRLLGPRIGLAYEAPGIRFLATAEILRVERSPDATGVAARLHDHRLVPLD